MMIMIVNAHLFVHSRSNVTSDVDLKLFRSTMNLFNNDLTVKARLFIVFTQSSVAEVTKLILDHLPRETRVARDDSRWLVFSLK